MSAVGHAFWIGIQPLPVEVTNHTSWWVYLIPVAGPTIVAILALYGVVRSNRTTVKVSRKEREDARLRDYLQWRRDELRRLGGEAVNAAFEAIDEYTKLPYRDELITKNDLGLVQEACRRLSANGEMLHALRAPITGDRCLRLRELILGRELLWAAKAYQRALSNDKASGKIRAVPSEAAREAESRFQGQLDNVRAAMVPFRYAVRSSLQHLDDVKPPPKSEPHY